MKITRISTGTQKEIEELNKLQRELANKILRIQLKAEENLLKELIATILKRPATLEDAKRVTLLYVQGVQDSYRFAFDGIILGTIIRHLDFIEFKPFEEWTKI